MQLNKQRGQPTRGGPPAWGFGAGLTTSYRKNKLITKCYKGPRTWTDSLGKWPKLQKMNMRFGTWKVRSLYRAGSIMTIAKSISKYKLDLVGVQEVRWDKGGTGPAGEHTFSMEREMRIMN
jgi:hypothetical protein